jgi:hypothetical protein
MIINRFVVSLLLLLVVLPLIIVITGTVPLQSANAFIKITSPLKNQTVPVGSNIQISGISNDNATSDCKVSIIVNAVKPYQPATPTGPGGAKDYSKWIFNISPQYTTIKEGQNKITARSTCLNNNNPLPNGATTNGTINNNTISTSRHYSVNVTGVAAAPSATAIPTKLPSLAIAGKSNITKATTNGGANSTCNGMDVTTCDKLDKLINGMTK